MIPWVFEYLDDKKMIKQFTLLQGILIVTLTSQSFAQTTCNLIKCAEVKYAKEVNDGSGRIWLQEWDCLCGSKMAIYVLFSFIYF